MVRKCQHIYERMREETVEIQGEFLTEEDMRERNFPENLTCIVTSSLSTPHPLLTQVQNQRHQAVLLEAAKLGAAQTLAGHVQVFTSAPNKRRAI